MRRRKERPAFTHVGAELKRKRGRNRRLREWGFMDRKCNLCSSGFRSTAPMRRAGPTEVKRGATCPDCIVAYRVAQAECDGPVEEAWYLSRRRRGPGMGTRTIG